MNRVIVEEMFKLQKNKIDTSIITNKKCFLPLTDWAIPQDVNIIKKGFTTSDGWNEKLNITVLNVTKFETEY